MAMCMQPHTPEISESVELATELMWQELWDVSMIVGTSESTGGWREAGHLPL